MVVGNDWDYFVKTDSLQEFIVILMKTTQALDQTSLFESIVYELKLTTTVSNHHRAAVYMYYLRFFSKFVGNKL